VHSDLLVGLERAKMRGRLLKEAMARMMGSEKAPRIVDTPMMAVGLTA
jgi:hypothetical protein